MMLEEHDDYLKYLVRRWVVLLYCFKENNEDWTRKLQRTLGKERSFLTYGIEMHSRLSLALLCTLPHSTRFASSSNCMVL